MMRLEDNPFASFWGFVSAYFQGFRTVNLFTVMEMFLEVFEEIDVFQYLLLGCPRKLLNGL